VSGANVLREDEPLETIFLTSVLIEKAPAPAPDGGSGWQENTNRKSLTLFEKCLALMSV
jgi:hypothetical protein